VNRCSGRERWAIDWYCCSSFDSPSVFGAILDANCGGREVVHRSALTLKLLIIPSRWLESS
jgi:hypothetical protein